MDVALGESLKSEPSGKTRSLFATLSELIPTGTPFKVVLGGDNDDREGTLTLSGSCWPIRGHYNLFACVEDFARAYGADYVVFKTERINVTLRCTFCGPNWAYFDRNAGVSVTPART